MNLQLHKDAEENMKKSVESLKDELQSIRAGRANPSLLNRVTVDYYGAMTPLNQLANISAPEPRLLVVQPYDAGALAEIEKAINASELGINPSNDGKIIRLNIPKLTEERRIELTKLVKKYGENAKISIRNHRRDGNDEVKKLVKDKELTEDEGKTAEEKVQKLTDEYINIIDEVIEEKEKELLEV
ncbi:MAG: ribosome recycling factor [Andreesenia angusta]|nr:ribosome recycling factor [Andreesenia angusta]